MAKCTGLKIDFQIQRRGSVKQSDWDKHRTPLAIYPCNIGPDWKDVR